MKRSGFKKKSSKKPERGLKTARTNAWKAHSLLVRLRDPFCVTCGEPTTEAGHFKHGNNMDFIHGNINGQCTRCNKFLHGNLAKYTLYLLDKYGREYVDSLDRAKSHPRKHTKDELIEIKEYYEQCRKELEGERL